MNQINQFAQLMPDVHLVHHIPKTNSLNVASVFSMDMVRPENLEALMTILADRLEQELNLPS